MQEYIDFAQNNALMVGAFFVILAFIIWNEFQSLTQKHNNVGVSEFVRLMSNENAAIIDVREDGEINNGMIQEAQHIRLAELSNRINEIEKFKQSPVLVYCRSGNRSNNAARQLTAQGFDKVYNLKGGIMAWESANMPLTKA